MTTDDRVRHHLGVQQLIIDITLPAHDDWIGSCATGTKAKSAKSLDWLEGQRRVTPSADEKIFFGDDKELSVQKQMWPSTSHGWLLNFWIATFHGACAVLVSESLPKAPKFVDFWKQGVDRGNAFSGQEQRRAGKSMTNASVS